MRREAAPEWRGAGRGAWWGRHHAVLAVTEAARHLTVADAYKKGIYARVRGSVGVGWTWGVENGSAFQQCASAAVFIFLGLEKEVFHAAPHCVL